MSAIKPLSGHGNIVECKCRQYLFGLDQWENKYHGKYYEKNKIKHVTFGNMRSAYATLAEEAGCLDSLISKSMGHTTGNTAQRNYLTASMMALKISAEMLGKYIGFQNSEK